jgi:hypothetical protein
LLVTIPAQAFRSCRSLVGCAASIFSRISLSVYQSVR